MEKYPSFKLVMDFVRDPAWSKARVEQLLEERCEHAQTVADVYMFSAEYLRIMSHQHVFQVKAILILSFGHCFCTAPLVPFFEEIENPKVLKEKKKFEKK